MALRRSLSLALSLLALSATAAFTLAATGADTDGGPLPGGDSATAVQALTTGSPEEAVAAVPEGFAVLHGYRPEVVDGLAVRPDGGCSSPVGLPASFEPACRQHDYGYDLLRNAEATGEPLGRWARGAIDDQFAAEVRALCDAEVDPESADRCRISAEIAVTGVELNSVRQGDGVPEESPLTQAALVSSTLGLLGLGVALPRRRR